MFGERFRVDNAYIGIGCVLLGIVLATFIEFLLVFAMLMSKAHAAVINEQAVRANLWMWQVAIVTGVVAPSILAVVVVRFVVSRRIRAVVTWVGVFAASISATWYMALLLAPR